MSVKTTPSTETLIPMINLSREYKELEHELLPAAQRVLSSGIYILGNETTLFEKDLAAYCQVPHAVGVNSGTDAILIALRALGVSAGDEVIVPAMTFIATAEPVVVLGAKPVFVDIDPATYTISPKSVEQKITRKTKAIIVVHLYGHMADMDAFARLSKQSGIPLIEDMAQSIGSEYRGKKAGSFGKLAALSFFPTKNLGACGDAGAVLSSSAQMDELLRSLRAHGAKIKYEHEIIGYNSRLDEMQSAILRTKLKHLDEWNNRRRKIAAFYDASLSSLPLVLPTQALDCKHVYHLYSIQTERRDALQAYLLERGIASALHYPKPLHLQKAMAFLGHQEGDFPVSEKLARQALSLPLYPQLQAHESERVSQAVHNFFRGV